MFLLEKGISTWRTLAERLPHEETVRRGPCMGQREKSQRKQPWQYFVLELMNLLVCGTVRKRFLLLKSHPTIDFKVVIVSTQ